MKEKVCTLLFLKRNDEILLAMKKRGFCAGRFNGVGGKVEANETIEQALVRECQEEIGVTPVRYEQIAEHDFLYPEHEEPKRMYTHVFFCDEWRGEPLESDEMKPEWFNLAKIPYSTMWPDDIIWLPRVLGGEKISSVFTFDENDTILTHSIKPVDSLPVK